MSEAGHNPMKWNCVNSGCFNLKRRPKIEVFHDILPGRISFGDVDGIVEINGNVLMLEWKSARNDLPIGQKIMYGRITKSSPITVLVLVGDAEEMTVTRMGWFFRGAYQEPQTAAMDDVRKTIADWVLRAQANPVQATYTTDIRL